MQMLFSVKFHTVSKGSFFNWYKPQKTRIWQYVLLFDLMASDIAHILKNSWSYLPVMIGYILSGKGFGLILTTKNQHEVIRVIAITDV